MENKIAIIGSGLAGLNCAKYLEKHNKFSIDVYEKNSVIGGRIQTDEVDGFLCDHGFQVFLTKYPEAMNSFIYNNLQLYNFKAGAKIDGEYVGDPFREPSTFFSTVFSSIGTLKDKILILKLRFERLSNLEKETALEFLTQYGFSQKMINQFFKPFFSGVFLNKDLENSADFFLFLYKLFSRSYATLPLNGMRDLPKNIADQLKHTTFHLNSSVEIKNSSTIEDNGEIKNYDFVISAFAQQETRFYSVTTDYFWANKSDAPYFSKALEIFTKNKYINHLAPISLVNPNYAPEDKILLSVNSLVNAPVEDIHKELAHIYPGLKLNFLKRYEVKKALPKINSPVPVSNEVIRCGDFLETPSINGALASGRKAAELICTNLS